MAKYFYGKITPTGQHDGNQYFTTRTGCFSVPVDKCRVTRQGLEHRLEASVDDIEVISGNIEGNIEDPEGAEHVWMDELQEQHKSADDSEKEDSVAATANTDNFEAWKTGVLIIMVLSTFITVMVMQIPISAEVFSKLNSVLLLAIALAPGVVLSAVVSLFYGLAIYVNKKKSVKVHVQYEQIKECPASEEILTEDSSDVPLYQKAEQNKSTDAAEASHRAVIQPAATPFETKESLISSEKSRSSHAPIGLMVLICCLMLSILAVIVLMLIQVVGIKKDVARLKTDVIAQGRYLRIIYNNLPNTDGIEYDLRSIKATLSVYSRTSPDTDQIESDLKAIKQKLNIYPY